MTYSTGNSTTPFLANETSNEAIISQ